MKRTTVLLLLLLLLSLAGSGYSAVLQSGWYVDIGLVDLASYIGYPQYTMTYVNWSPTITAGTYGPLQVATDTAQYPPWPVKVTVPATQTVPDGTAVDFYGQLQYPPTFVPISY